MWFLKDEAPSNVALWPIAFANKSLTSAETQYSNTEREDLGIIHSLKKFHHYCFAFEANTKTDQTPLVKIFKSMWYTYHTAYQEYDYTSTNTT